MLQLMGWDFMNLNYYLLGIINEQILCDFFFPAEQTRKAKS